METNELIELYIEQTFPDIGMEKLAHGLYIGKLDDGADVVISNMIMTRDAIEVKVSLGEEKIIENFFMKDKRFFQIVS